MFPKLEFAHLDIFGDVAEDFAALDDAVTEHCQATPSDMISPTKSFAMSTALSTDMPTSAAFSASRR